MAVTLAKLSLALIIFMLPYTNKAQNNDFEAGLLNVGLGSVLGGIGAVINREPDEKIGKIFLKGMGQGALGGFLVFESKRLVREFATSGNYGYVWPSKIINSAGTSIIENAAANRNFWTRWHLNFGFNRVELNTKENFEITYRIMPFALFSTIANATEGRFNLSKSLKLGTFVFTANKLEMPNGDFANGFARTNSIVLVNNLSGKTTEAHELIHVYQYEGFSGINSFFLKKNNKLQAKYPLVNYYSKIFYTDLNAGLWAGFYALENLNAQEYQDNFLEHEAFYFSN